MVYAAEHRIVSNSVTSQLIKYKQPAIPVVFLNAVSVKYAEKVKYLDVLLYAVLKDDNHIQKEVKSVYCAAYMALLLNFYCS